MLKRLFVFALCLVFSISVLSVAMFSIDYYRCAKLEKPLFALGINTADDGGSGLYRGLGYTVSIDGALSAEYGYVVNEIEMYLLGNLVFAAIT